LMAFAAAATGVTTLVALVDNRFYEACYTAQVAVAVLMAAALVISFRYGAWRLTSMLRKQSVYLASHVSQLACAEAASFSSSRTEAGAIPQDVAAAAEEGRRGGSVFDSVDRSSTALNNSFNIHAKRIVRCARAVSCGMGVFIAGLCAWLVADVVRAQLTSATPGTTFLGVLITQWVLVIASHAGCGYAIVATDTYLLSVLDDRGDRHSPAQCT